MAEGEKSSNGADSYTHEELLAEPQIVGVRRHILAGALAVSKRKTLTVEQAKGEVEKALKRPAVVDAEDDE